LRVVSLYSIKGGVGKTATCVNLAYLSAKNGFKTLLCDLDPQGSSTYYFKVKPSKKFDSKRFIYGTKTIKNNIKETDYENLDILPSDFSFRKMEVLLSGIKKSKKVLRDNLKSFGKNYDYVFLDCPPNITLVSENIFYASDLILEPCIPTTLSMLTHKKLNLYLKKKSFKDLKFYSFFSMTEKIKKLHQEILNKLLGKGRFLKTQIPYSSLVEKMGIYREPVCIYNSQKVKQIGYDSLWQEVKQIFSNGLSE
jgi:cellulose biosynthesis protein BcsQ